MQMKTSLTLCALVLSISITGCAIKTADEDPATEYATLEVDTTTEGEGGSVVMTEASCTNDADTGFFSGTFTGDNEAMLTIKIKGFSTSAGTYTCTQASDNTEGGIGNKFDSCTVELVIPDPELSSNAYAMHRETEDTKAFTYAGDCTLSTTYEEPRVSASIDCSGLVQTVLQGAPRNPIDPNVTAHITNGSTFFCDLL